MRARRGRRLPSPRPSPLQGRGRQILLVLVLWSGAAVAQVDPDPWFGTDKALHFSFSAGLAGAGYGTTALFSEDRIVRAAVGAGFALGLGIAKELADLAGLWGHPSWRDFAWDVAGTTVGVLVSWVLDRFVFTPLFPPHPLPARLEGSPR
jgi:putative lipoprotein